MRCGYQLVGPPMPTRCPECGYPVVYQSRWREGELHRSGPTIVWPIARRFAFVAVMLGASIALAFVFYWDALRQIKLVSFSTARWLFLPFLILAPIASMLWLKPINGPGSDTWGLHRQAALRSWWPFFGFWFWPVALCVIEDLRIQSTQTNNPTPSLWFQAATWLLVPALAGWTLVLFQVARVSLYLRNELLHRLWMGWAWTAPIAMIVALCVGWGKGDFQIVADFLWLFTWVAMVLSLLLGALTAWDLAHCLTHCYDTVAREERLAKQNAERYTTPK
ncbi:MAG: hypothetical protein K8R92_07450 [Planctomycetes bacterium]|nr:hypothetical protein [Planctomycetota bacterium]